MTHIRGRWRRKPWSRTDLERFKSIGEAERIINDTLSYGGEVSESDFFHRRGLAKTLIEEYHSVVLYCKKRGLRYCNIRLAGDSNPDEDAVIRINRSTSEYIQIVQGCENEQTALSRQYLHQDGIATFPATYSRDRRNRRRIVESDDGPADPVESVRLNLEETATNVLRKLSRSYPKSDVLLVNIGFGARSTIPDYMKMVTEMHNSLSIGASSFRRIAYLCHGHHLFLLEFPM